jgi:hypothetical protein
MDFKAASKQATPASLLRELPILLLTAAGFLLTVVVIYPGYMTNDAGFVYQMAKEWRFGDWQSPFMSILWRLVDPIAPGPASIFLLITSAYWLAFGLLALTVARRSRWLGLTVPLLALMPPAFMLLSMIWRDVLFGVVWLLAAAAVYAIAGRPSPLRRPVQALALVLVALGILLRPNAILAAPLLAGYVLWPERFAWKRAAIAFIPLALAGYAVLHLAYYVVLDVERQNPLHSLLVFDLGGITHFTGQNQFPVTWSADETTLLTTRCYDPSLWDAYWTREPCRFVMQRLERKDDRVFGTPRLVEAWARAVLAHPLAYLQHRATYLWTFLAGPHFTLELYPGKIPLADNPRFQALLVLHAALKPTVLFRSGFWLLLAGAVCIAAWPRRMTPSGAFAIGTSGSAVVYVLTFFVTGVASDFRYAYWCVLAALAGAIPAMLARREPSAGR